MHGGLGDEMGAKVVYVSLFQVKLAKGIGAKLGEVRLS